MAKCVLNIPTTKALIERLTIDSSLRRIVGYDRKNAVPNESTFSRAFAEFENMELFQHNHGTLIKTHLSDTLIDNLSRDATAIEAREKPTPFSPPSGPPQRLFHEHPAKSKFLAASRDAILALRIRQTPDLNVPEGPSRVTQR